MFARPYTTPVDPDDDGEDDNLPELIAELRSTGQATNHPELVNQIADILWLLACKAG